MALHNDGVNDFIAADGVLDDLNTTQLGYSINLWFYPEDNYPCSTAATNVGRRQVCPTTSGIIWSFKSKVVNAVNVIVAGAEVEVVAPLLPLEHAG